VADEALEDALYDSQAMRSFAGIDLSVEAVPDATTLLKFRHLLEAHDLTEVIFAEVGALLSERKLLMREGTIVDATIIAAPSSTKNARKERDPEMHQTKKGNQWYFGMKAHIGVDAQSGLVHSVSGTAANVADIAQTHALLHGEEQDAYADAGYLGIEKREEITLQCPDLEWHVAAKRGKVWPGRVQLGAAWLRRAWHGQARLGTANSRSCESGTRPPKRCLAGRHCASGEPGL